jgi:hypothetical protein
MGALEKLMGDLNASPKVPDNGLCFRVLPSDTDARAAKLTAIAEFANLSERKPHEFGPVSISSTIDIEERAPFVQFSTTTSSSAGDTEIRVFMSIDSIDSIIPAVCADDLVDVLLRLRHPLGDAPGIAELHLIIGRILARTAGISPARILGTGVTTRDTDYGCTITTEIGTLGHDLVSRPERIIAWTFSELEDLLDDLVVKHNARQMLLTEAASTQAIGWINAAALRLVDASGMGRSKVIQHLQGQDRLLFRFDDDAGRSCSAGLYWYEGIIFGDAEYAGADWYFEGTRLSIERALPPETTLVAMVGRRIGEVVDQNLVPPAATITAVEILSAKGFQIDLAIEAIPIDGASGLLSGPVRYGTGGVCNDRG